MSQGKIEAGKDSYEIESFGYPRSEPRARLLHFYLWSVLRRRGGGFQAQYVNAGQVMFL